MTVIRPVVLSGGSGTRLWPLSTPEAPKQFADLVDGASLFEQTLRRLGGLPGVARPTVVTGGRHLAIIAEQANRIDVDLGVALVEPEGRNTAPACIAAALVADPDDVMVILPSDHLIEDEDGFRDAVASAVAHALDGHIVTFGITPDFPHTGYGYIEMGEPVGDARRVVRFKEKPASDEAEHLISDGLHVWNSGMFVASAGVLIEEASTFCPDLVETVRSALVEPEEGLLVLGEEFGQAQSISLDHAVMEKTSRALVLPVDLGWNDIGSFEALWAISEKDRHGNAVEGEVRLADVTNSYVRALTRPVAVAGLDNVIVVEAQEGVLVVSKDRTQLVRDVADPD